MATTTITDPRDSSTDEPVLTSKPGNPVGQQNNDTADEISSAIHIEVPEKHKKGVEFHKPKITVDIIGANPVPEPWPLPEKSPEILRPTQENRKETKRQHEDLVDKLEPAKSGSSASGESDATDDDAEQIKRLEEELKRRQDDRKQKKALEHSKKKIKTLEKIELPLPVADPRNELIEEHERQMAMLKREHERTLAQVTRERDVANAQAHETIHQGKRVEHEKALLYERAKQASNQYDQMYSDQEMKHLEYQRQLRASEENQIAAIESEARAKLRSEAEQTAATYKKEFEQVEATIKQSAQTENNELVRQLRVREKLYSRSENSYNEAEKQWREEERVISSSVAKDKLALRQEMTSLQQQMTSAYLAQSAATDVEKLQADAAVYELRMQLENTESRIENDSEVNKRNEAEIYQLASMINAEHGQAQLTRDQFNNFKTFTERQMKTHLLAEKSSFELEENQLKTKLMFSEQNAYAANAQTKQVYEMLNQRQVSEPAVTAASSRPATDRSPDVNILLEIQQHMKNMSDDMNKRMDLWTDKIQADLSEVRTEMTKEKGKQFYIGESRSRSLVRTARKRSASSVGKRRSREPKTRGRSAAPPTRRTHRSSSPPPAKTTRKTRSVTPSGGGGGGG